MSSGMAVWTLAHESMNQGRRGGGGYGSYNIIITIIMKTKNKNKKAWRQTKLRFHKPYLNHGFIKIWIIILPHTPHC